jgi:hypothetical protein
MEQAGTTCSRDLAKPLGELTRDIYTLAAMGSPGAPLGGYPVQASMHCNKIMVAMMAKVALSNEAAQRGNDALQSEMRSLTRIGIYLAIVATICGAIQALGVIVAWIK